MMVNDDDNDHDDEIFFIKLKIKKIQVSKISQVELSF
jgi:hypothetical protein